MKNRTDAEFKKFVNDITKELCPKNKDTINKMIENIRNDMKKYIINSDIKSLVLGVSGGLDSALISAIFGKNSGIPIPLIGISIPMSSTNAHKEQAQWVGDTYCDFFREFNAWDFPTNDFNEDSVFNIIGDVLSKNNDIAGKPQSEKMWNVRQGNIKARLRMITLYDVARNNNGMVLSTDNYSELLAGFWTLHGDVGDYGAIQELFKGSEVPALAKYLGVREDIINQAPSDGLGVTEENTDEAQLGMSYKEFDAVVAIEFGIVKNRDLVERYNKLKDENHPIIIKALKREKNFRFKRENPYNIKRKNIM